MTSPTKSDAAPSSGGQRPEDAQGSFAGLPYDLRPPTAADIRSRLWNRGDPHLFPPKAFGWGYTINFYWLFHPLRYLRSRRWS